MSSYEGTIISFKYCMGANCSCNRVQIEICDGYEGLVDYPCIEFSLESGCFFLVCEEGLEEQVAVVRNQIQLCRKSFRAAGQD